MMKQLLIITAAAILVMSCSSKSQKADDPLADSGRTQRTEDLLTNLKALGDSSVYLFGQHDATVYGIGWQADYANDSTVHQRSDVKSVCGDHPALLSFDLGRLELGDSLNLDSVPFQRIRQEVIAHFNRGGLISLSWTDGDATKTVAVADFLQSLETPYGVKVPVVFRLRGQFTADVWRTVVSQFREHGVTNALYAYSPGTESDGDEAKYLERYPGDDYIDLLGLDCYCWAPDADTTQVARYAATLDKNLQMVCAIAKQRHKAVALTETGYECLKTPDWWTHALAPVLAKHPICYALAWRNAHNRPNHFFAPYPGQQSASDFIRFYNDPRTLFLSDVNGLYLKK